MRYHQRLPREPRREPPQKNPVLEAKPCQEAEPDKQILLMAALLARSPANTGAMLESMLPHIGPPAERERLKLRCATAATFAVPTACSGCGCFRAAPGRPQASSGSLPAQKTCRAPWRRQEAAICFLPSAA